MTGLHQDQCTFQLGNKGEIPLKLKKMGAAIGGCPMSFCC
jgi:hypothetical protein